MPTYEYVCDACSHRLEEFQSITDQPLVKCPMCRKKKLRRLIGGGAALVFKGSGFYQTDYRSESYQKGRKAAESGEKGASAASGSTSGKSDAVPKSTATKSESPA